jgi:outer membrane protein TolC
LRERQQRLALVDRDAQAQRQTLELTRQRRAAGTASQLDLEQQRDKLEQSEAARIPLAADRDAYLNALAVLTGQAPGALDATLATTGPVPLPPASVPVSDPESLIRRRPDVRAAERQYAAATARIGVAEAARFPTLSFMGLIGIGGTHVDDVVDPDNLAAIALPRLSWNFLDFGRTASQVEKAKGAQDEAAAQYRAAVLKALQDSEDALARYGASRRTAASAARSLATADRSTALMRQRFAAGTGSRIQLLDAERQSLTAAQALSQANGAMTANFVALQKALGLGWHE